MVPGNTYMVHELHWSIMNYVVILKTTIIVSSFAIMTIVELLAFHSNTNNIKAKEKSWTKLAFYHHPTEATTIIKSTSFKESLLSLGRFVFKS